ncbi:MAG: DUF2165 domain-containing protein [Bacteroidota bacterium]
MSIRYSVMSLAAAIGLYMTLVVVNNLTDYGSNFAFVSHVLSMDDTFSANKGMWRAISQPLVHHIAYVLIILTESIIAILCLLGSWNLWKNRFASPKEFRRARKLAVYGLLLGFLLWFTGFVSIGGEWFLMWQSSHWNGTEVAMRNALMFLLVMFYLNSVNVPVVTRSIPSS